MAAASSKSAPARVAIVLWASSAAAQVGLHGCTKVADFTEPETYWWGTPTGGVTPRDGPCGSGGNVYSVADAGNGKLVYACGKDGAWLCDSGATAATPAHCSGLELKGCRQLKDVAVDLANGIMWAACDGLISSYVVRCGWDGSGKVTDCGWVKNSHCPTGSPSGVVVGQTSTSSSTLLVGCHRGGMMQCKVKYSPAIGTDYTASCEQLGDNPCNEDNKGSKPTHALSLDSTGKGTAGCSKENKYKYCDFSWDKGLTNCAESLGTAPCHQGALTNIAELPSGRTGVACSTDGYFECITTTAPTPHPTTSPTKSPTGAPSAVPSAVPTRAPSGLPTESPANPSAAPTRAPTAGPSVAPTQLPSAVPTVPPSGRPSASPSVPPTGVPLPPTTSPTTSPSPAPSQRPSAAEPSRGPSGRPLIAPTAAPTRSPSASPTGASLSHHPSSAPTGPPSWTPTLSPSSAPSGLPSLAPTPQPSAAPERPTAPPSPEPTPRPTVPPTGAPTRVPIGPSLPPSKPPTLLPLAALPSASPSSAPSRPPSPVPSVGAPSASPTRAPTLSPSLSPPRPGRNAVQATLPDASAEAAAVALSFSTCTGPAMGNLAMANTVCNSAGTMRDLGRALHPTALELGGNMYFGCLAGAVILVCGATVLSYSALVIVRLTDENGDGILGKDEIHNSCLKHIPVVNESEAIDIAAVVRHPNTILVVVLFLYQGASFASLRLLIAHQDESGEEVPTWERIAGGIFAAALAVFPYWIYRMVRRGITPMERDDLPGMGPQVRARVREWDDPKPPRWLQWVLLSEHGDWVSCFRRKHWINSWDAAVRHFEGDYAAPGIAVDMWAMWCLSFTNAFPTRSSRACGHVRLAAAAVHMFQLLFCGMLRPYRCVRDDIARSLTLLLLASALVLLAVGFYRAADDEQETWHDGDTVLYTAGVLQEPAEIIMQCATAVVLLQALLRIAAEVLLLVKGWRANSQTLEWAEREAQQAKLNDSLLLTAGPAAEGRGNMTPLGPRRHKAPIIRSPLLPVDRPFPGPGSPGRAASSGRGAILSPANSINSGMSFTLIDLVGPGSGRAQGRGLPQLRSRALTSQGRRWRAGRGSPTVQSPTLAPSAQSSPQRRDRALSASERVSTLLEGPPAVMSGRQEQFGMSPGWRRLLFFVPHYGIVDAMMGPEEQRIAEANATDSPKVDYSAMPTTPPAEQRVSFDRLVLGLAPTSTNAALAPMRPAEPRSACPLRPVSQPVHCPLRRPPRPLLGATTSLELAGRGQ
eukprot:TRINITY_DN8615_c1_g1_i9.p1 TRINITY_DN8615_c1_g1~~TRINITY_DN8615_c1_g1_i9.p1  ORF type:complete len:1287 (+),score=162.38 TRINITY_DN8615_c1_g1_i9:77-3862(+)